ncbi:hypothetical protein CGERO_05725 [Corynebacterium gerontici]|uniref:Uncharacterized protein n=1 Tax=Corynebacterium gerontici TaxID=2079234 RepID=A0A3G6J0G6_9CORY|nr:hypothetical protein CGERO_05725 [Corynebacterium gerontici]
MEGIPTAVFPGELVEDLLKAPLLHVLLDVFRGKKADKVAGVLYGSVIGSWVDRRNLTIYRYSRMWGSTQ